MVCELLFSGKGSSKSFGRIRKVEKETWTETAFAAAHAQNFRQNTSAVHTKANRIYTKVKSSPTAAPFSWPHCQPLPFQQDVCL